MSDANAGPAPASANRVVELDDGVVEGIDWPLVPDGHYDARYVDHDVVEVPEFGWAVKLFIKFRLYDAGEHTGKVLYRAYRVKRRISRKRFAVVARSHFLEMYCRVLNYRRRPDRITLRDFKRHLFRVSVRTVTKGGTQRALPAALQYSVIADILCTVTD